MPPYLHLPTYTYLPTPTNLHLPTYTYQPTPTYLHLPTYTYQPTPTYLHLPTYLCRPPFRVDLPSSILNTWIDLCPPSPVLTVDLVKRLFPFLNDRNVCLKSLNEHLKVQSRMT